MGNRGAYIVRRVLMLIPTLLVIYTLTFVLIHATPGGPWSQGDKPVPPHRAQAAQCRLWPRQAALAPIRRLPLECAPRRFRPLVHLPLPHRDRHHQGHLPGLAPARHRRDDARRLRRHHPRRNRRDQPQHASRLRLRLHLDRRHLDAVVRHRFTAGAAALQPTSPRADRRLERHHRART